MADIFVVGSPRSGTTWLRTLLAGHPDVVSPPELHLFPRYLWPAERAWHAEIALAQRRREAGVRVAVGLSDVLDHADLLEWMRDLYRRTRSATLGIAAGPTRLLEKTPGNARLLPLIRQIVPGARFVHIVRDPRDVVASLLERGRRAFGEWAPRDVVRATSLWREHVLAATRDARPDDTLLVRYEDLHSGLHDTLRLVADFLDLRGDVDSWLVGDPSMRASERERYATATSAAAVESRDYPDARGIQTEIDAPTSTALSRLELWYVECHCRSEMSALGYDLRIFSPDRPQLAWHLAAALDRYARRLARVVLDRM